MQRTVQWVTTTQLQPWQQQDALTFGPVQGMPGGIVLPNQVHQTIEGFGACFKEPGQAVMPMWDDASVAGKKCYVFLAGVGRL